MARRRAAPAAPMTRWRSPTQARRRKGNCASLVPPDSTQRPPVEPFDHQADRAARRALPELYLLEPFPAGAKIHAPESGTGGAAGRDVPGRRFVGEELVAVDDLPAD